MLNHFPIKYPSIIVLNIEAIVRTNPSLPAANALVAFIPNPNPTTENCNKTVIALWLKCKNGFPDKLATNNPNNNAIGGDIIEVRQSNNKKTKIICFEIVLISNK